MFPLPLDRRSVSSGGTIQGNISRASVTLKIRGLLNEGKKLAEMEHHPSFFRHETKGIFLRIGRAESGGSKESPRCMYTPVIVKIALHSRHRHQGVSVVRSGAGKKAIKDLC